MMLWMWLQLTCSVFVTTGQSLPESSLLAKVEEHDAEHARGLGGKLHLHIRGGHDDREDVSVTQLQDY